MTTNDTTTAEGPQRHFAFAPDLPDDARDDLVLTIGEELRDRLRNQQQA